MSDDKSAESSYNLGSSNDSDSESNLIDLSDGHSGSDYIHSLSADSRLSSKKPDTEMDGSRVISSDLEDTSAGTSSSDLNPIPTHVPPAGENEEIEATREVISDTRKYLKKHGTMEFLDKYLPTTTASSLDLLQLIKKLGFLPKDIPPFNDGDRLIGLIKLLHTAMKKVNSMRSKLDDFYCVEHVVTK